MSKPYMIEVTDLSKNYVSKKRLGLFKSEKKIVEALRGVSFNVEQGEIFGLLGPNGAGKTTLIKILTTLLLPTSGTAKINGFSLEEDRGIKASIGAMLMGERGLYWKLTGRENLDYFGSLYHVPKQTRKERIKSLVDLLELEEFVDRTVETLSSGQKMKLVFARSLINDAPLLLLDEPTNTLDVKEARRLRQIVKEQNEDQGKTIVYCTHIMQEADELCHRIGIIDKGKIIAIDEPETLKDNLRETDSLSIEGTIPEVAISAVNALPSVLTANILTKRNGSNGSAKDRPYLSVICKDSRLALPDIITTLSKNGAIIRDLSRIETTLEDVFLSKTGRSLMDDTSENTVSKPAA